MKTINLTCFKLRHLVFPYVLLGMILSSVYCQAQNSEEKYFVTTAGKQIAITDIIRVTGDSVFFTGNYNYSFLPIESLAEYHHTAPGKTVKGTLIGAGVGILFGVIIGAAAEPPVDNTNLGTALISSYERSAYPATGALIGMLVGAGAGAAIGSAQRIDVHIAFAGLTHAEKYRTLLNIAGPDVNSSK